MIFGIWTWPLLTWFRNRQKKEEGKAKPDVEIEEHETITTKKEISTIPMTKLERKIMMN